MVDEVLEHDDLKEDQDNHENDHRTSLGISNMKLAMWLFLGSEVLLFGGLISAYLLSKENFLAALQAGNPNVIDSLREFIEKAPEKYQEILDTNSVFPIFDIPFTSASSFILLMSSLTMVLAHKSISEGNYKNTSIWLAATALLGSIFIGGQVYEFTVFHNEGIYFDRNLFGSAFYTLTGFHGLHVTVGVIMLLSLLIMSLRGKLRQDRAETVELVGLYWHFVDIVWVLIFTIVYLIP